MRSRAWVVAVVLLVAAAGCGDDSDPAPEAKPSPAEAVVRSIDPAKAEVLEPGKDLEVVAELPKKAGKQDVYFSGFTEDGLLLGSMSLPEPPGDAIPGPTTTQSYPFIYDPETKGYTILDEEDRPKPTWAGDFVSDGDVVAWVEGQGHGIGTSDFTIRAYDRTTEKVSDLARFSDPDGQIVYGDDLVLHSDHAYFSTPTYPAKRDQEAVYSVPVDGSAPAKVLATRGQRVELDGDVLTYAVGKTRRSRDLATDTTTQAWESPHATETGFCGAVRTEAFETWCVGTPVSDPTDLDADNIADPVLSIRTSSGATAVLERFPGGSENYPTPTDISPYGDWVGFMVSGGDWPAPQYLVDPDSGALWTLPTDCVLTAVSPDGTWALFNEVTGDGSAPQRVVRIPDPEA